MAVEAYGGPFLDGDDWVLQKRERLHSIFVRSCFELMHSATRCGKHERALDYGRRIIDTDPLRESVQRDVMLLLVISGQQVKALVAYQKLRSVLPSIAVVSLACRFPDACSPTELWANLLEGRQFFRPIPRERLDLVRHGADEVGEAASIASVCAGLLTGWSFNRARLRIAKSTFEATDLTHWLALKIAAEAIKAIGDIEWFNRTRSAVVVANTLMGEFSRASLLRLRAPSSATERS